jgi:hypothetical protein
MRLSPFISTKMATIKMWKISIGKDREKLVHSYIASGNGWK